MLVPHLGHLVPPGGTRAAADGKRVVMGRKFPAFAYPEELLAAALAHEFAHNLLAHRAWLTAAVAGAFRRAGHPAPEEAARRWLVLRDGAMVAGYLDGGPASSATLAAGVRDLLSERP